MSQRDAPKRARETRADRANGLVHFLARRTRGVGLRQVGRCRRRDRPNAFTPIHRTGAETCQNDRVKHELLEVLKQGAEVWNVWRREHPNEAIDLSGAKLRRSRLASADLRGANLARADLREADLAGADLTQAVLSDIHGGNASFERADLSGVCAWGAGFWRANLTDANLAGAELWQGNFANAVLTRANLTGADLTGARLVECDLRHAVLRNAIVYGVAVWKVRLDDAIQSELVITQPTEPRITVDDLELAQFVYLLLNHQKLRHILNAFTQKGVLLLGPFRGGGLDLLRAIAAELRRGGYLPIIFDFDRPAGRDLTETVKTLVGLCRFVIVHLNGPSVPQELYATVPFFSVPFIPLVESAVAPYSMFADLLKYPWVLKPVEFSSQDHLLEILPQNVIGAAEELYRSRQAILDRLFPG